MINASLAAYTMSKLVYAIATMDTKGRELAYLADRLRSTGVDVLLIDVGTLDSPSMRADIGREQVARHHPDPEVDQTADRGRAIFRMSEALTQFLRAEYEAGKIAGVIGLGGSGGTALITPAMRALPIGLPKLMVSTLASGNTTAYVGTSDIVMVPSVVDVAGLNAVSRRILSNAAHALAGMVLQPTGEESSLPALGLTMFGVTTPCVSIARQALEDLGYDPLVFHATGTGGRAMEDLVSAGLIRGVLDVTTTEVADFLVGGIFPCLPNRFDAILAARVPYVVSVGALDMVNFGASDTVPVQFRDRRLHVHNAEVTLMRTTPEENREFGRWIAARLNQSRSPLGILLPEGGVSSLDCPGQPFHDPDADALLFETIETQIVCTPHRRVIRLPWHINDPRFAKEIVNEFLRVSTSEVDN